VSFLLVVPFLLILLAIALLPLMVPHWWKYNSNKALVTFILGAPVAGVPDIWLKAINPGLSL
jgi:hypothetical protein